jgi:hypothetical protein
MGAAVSVEGTHHVELKPSDFDIEAHPHLALLTSNDDERNAVWAMLYFEQ